MDKRIGKFHHIGYLVKNMAKSIEAYHSIGFVGHNEPYYDLDRKSYIFFMYGNDTTIELIEPAKESYIYPLINKFRNVPYHVCYEVDDMNHALNEMTSNGFIISKPTERALAISASAQVTFLTHPRVGIIELVSNI